MTSKKPGAWIRFLLMSRRLSCRGSKKEEARPPARLPHFPRSPESDDAILRVRKRQMSDLSALFTLKRENVAETSLVISTAVNPASKSPENCRSFIIGSPAGGAMNRYLMGFFPPPSRFPPKGTRRGPVPPSVPLLFDPRRSQEGIGDAGLCGGAGTRISGSGFARFVESSEARHWAHTVGADGYGLPGARC